MVWHEFRTASFVVAMKNRRYRCADGPANTLNYHYKNSELGILCVPALGVRAAKYDRLLDAIASQGYSAGSFDLRGIGASEIRASRGVNYGYHEQIEYELPAAIDAFLETTNCKSLILFGHSIGGHISVLGQCHNIQQLKGIVVCASATVYHRNWPFPISLIALFITQMTPVISFLFGYYPGNYLGFGSKEAKRTMSDFAHTGKSGEFKLGMSDRDFLTELKLKEIPVLAINFENDWYATRKGTDHLLSFLPNAKVERKSFNKFQLNLKSASHFTWMKRPNVITATIIRWLQKHSLAE